MEDQAKSSNALPSDQLNRAMSAIAQRSQRMVSDFLDRQQRDPPANAFDPLHIGDAFLQMTAQILASPVTLAEAQMSLWNDYLQLWQRTAAQMMGSSPTPTLSPPTPVEPADAAATAQQSLFDFIAQSYLLTARWIQTLVGEAEQLDEATLGKVDFYTRQFIDALSPAAVFESNPDLLGAILASNGEALVKGLDQLLHHLEQAKHRFRTPRNQVNAFHPGGQVALTSGKVVLRNPTMELLHFAANGPVRQPTPMLIVPSWTEKYYLLDLEPELSLIKWLCDHGFELFLISWSGADRDFAETIEHGMKAAVAAIERATGRTHLHGVGVGLGGTLLAAFDAWLAATGGQRFVSTSYLASMLDFSRVGAISVFVDEEQLRFEGPGERAAKRQVPAMLGLLRASDLIWSFVLDSYQLRSRPFPFDLLAWNADLPLLPASLQRFYLQALYQNNLLAQPGALSLWDAQLDLGRITTPSYVLAMSEDHLVPWRSAYVTTQLLGGPVRFVLAESGHATGLVNPPSQGRYSYWTPGRGHRDADIWLKAARRQPGSWWQDWGRWLEKLSGKPDALAHPPERTDLGDAPGLYVRQRS